MARSISVIKQQLLDAKNAEAALAGLTSTSQVSIWNAQLRVQATVINLFEQLQDIFKAEIEAIADATAPSTPSWVQDRVFKFQYDAADPQIIQLVDFVPAYPVVDATKRIVTRCSVKTDDNKQVNVKVAKSEPPAVLSTAEANALKSYLDHIMPAGVSVNLVNLVSDKLYVEADIYYDGQYASIISDNVITAMKAFLAAIPFDGIMKLSSLTDAIQDVAGVNDVVLKNVKARRDDVLFASATDLVLNYDVITRSWDAYAGYIVEETAPNDFATTLNFIVG